MVAVAIGVVAVGDEVVEDRLVEELGRAFVPSVAS